MDWIDLTTEIQHLKSGFRQTDRPTNRETTGRQTDEQRLITNRHIHGLDTLYSV